MLDIFGFFIIGVLFLFLSSRKKFVGALAVLLAIGSPADETLGLTKEQKQKAAKGILVVLGIICMATSGVLFLTYLFNRL